MKKILNPFYNKYESILDKIVPQVDKGLETISQAPKYILKKYNSIIENIDDQIYDRFNKDTELARLMRYGALPWSLIIPKSYKYLFSNAYGRALIFSSGVHMVRAPVGGGKSITSFILAEIYLEEHGLGSYFTSPVEKPQITEDGKWKYVYHRYIDLDSYFKDGRKIKKFNTEKHKVIHKDERHLEFNPRLNNTGDYKGKFIPQQKDEILMRHQGISHIYKYSQYTKLDSQDMQALTYMHDVETVKDIPIQRWLDTGLFKYVPVKIKVSTFVIDVSFKGEMKRKKIGSCKIPISYELLQRFDTHAEKYRDAGIPVDYK
jgi:hypothetical protein